MSLLQYLNDLLYITDPCIKLIQLFIAYWRPTLKDVVGVLKFKKNHTHQNVSL